MQSLDLLFLVIFISFYINRYFSQVFRTSFNIIEEKEFRHKFYFFNRFTHHYHHHHHHHHHHPPTSQNPLSLTIIFCQCSLLYHGFSRLLCYDYLFMHLCERKKSFIEILTLILYVKSKTLIFSRFGNLSWRVLGGWVWNLASFSRKLREGSICKWPLSLVKLKYFMSKDLSTKTL